MTLPAGATVFKTTAVFDEHTVPPALLRHHRTKEGVWGRVVVVDGELTFRQLEPAPVDIVLTPGAVQIVAPGLPHEVRLGPGARFYVEFLRIEPTAAA